MTLLLISDEPYTLTHQVSSASAAPCYAQPSHVSNKHCCSALTTLPTLTQLRIRCTMLRAAELCQQAAGLLR